MKLLYSYSISLFHPEITIKLSPHLSNILQSQLRNLRQQMIGIGIIESEIYKLNHFHVRGVNIGTCYENFVISENEKWNFWK